MPINPEIPLSVRPFQQVESPLRSYGIAAESRQRQEDLDSLIPLRQQEAQMNDMKIRQAAQDASEQAAANTALQTSGGDFFKAADALFQAGHGKVGMSLYNEGAARLKDKTAQAIQEEDLKGKAMSHAAQIASMFDGTNSAVLVPALRATASLIHPDLAKAVPDELTPAFVQQTQQMAMSVAEHHAALKDAADWYAKGLDVKPDGTVGFIPGGEADLKREDAFTKAYASALGAVAPDQYQATLQGLAKEHPVPASILQRFQQAGSPDKARLLGMTAEQQTQAAQQAAELAEKKRAADQAAEGSSLTPASLDKVAEMFATTGTLPPLGMGAAAAKDRRAIINRASEMFPNVTLASNAAQFKANQSSLQNVTRTLDTLTAFENTASKNLDQFLSLAEKLPDTGSPWLNTPLRSVNVGALGSAEQAAANAARIVALREIARVTNDPKLSGVLSDSARQEVLGLSPQNATFAQIQNVAKVLKQDMANVHSSLAEQRSAIQGRLGVGGNNGGGTTEPATTPTAATASGFTRMKGPDGSVHDVANADVEKAKARGATVVGGGG